MKRITAWMLLRLADGCEWSGRQLERIGYWLLVKAVRVFRLIGR